MAARLCTILLLLQATIVNSYCKVGWSGACGGSLGARTAQSAITHYVETDSGVLSTSTYNAEVIFHWGPENTVIESADYLVLDPVSGEDKQNTIQRTYTYDSDGVYYVGYSVIFGEGSPCPGSVIQSWYRLTTSDCSFSEEVAKDEVPTWTPTNAPIITSSATERPTPSPITSSPTKNPTTGTPSKNPTKQPTASAPSKQPIDAPTSSRPTPKPTPESTNAQLLPTPQLSSTSTPTTQAPTVSPTIEGTPANQGREQTEEPTLSATRPTTSKPVKTPAPQTSAPVEPGATSPPTSMEIEDTIAPVGPGSTTSPPYASLTSEEAYTVSSTIMVLYHSGKLDEGAEEIWTDVTIDTIQRSVANMADVEANEVNVEVTLDNQEIIADDSGRLRILTKSSSDDIMSNDVGVGLVRTKWIPLSHHDGPLRNRKLQSSTSPLQIKFTTRMSFPSDKDDWDENELVASGFRTQTQQSDYLTYLKEESNGSYFDTLESMTMEVDGKLVKEESAPDGADGAVENPDGDGGKDSSMPIIIGGVVGGVCFLIFVTAIGIYYAKRNQSDRKEMRTLSAKQSTTEMQQEEQQQQAEMMPNSNKPVMETQTAGVTEDDMIEPGALCFGTIESKEGAMDDVSKMSEWDFEGALNTGMDADNTVGESIISSQQKLFVYGVKNQRFGTDGMSHAGGSTINTGTIGSKGMIFGDDATMEDIYNTPDGGGQSPSFQRMTVVAGPGKLGIVLDNPNGDLPLVHAIKESSPLNGKIRVGDLLLSVDERDCRGMMANKLSKLLTSRSQNPTRTLVLARGSGGIQASHIR